MIIKDICVKKEVDRNGQKKTFWNKIGVLREVNGKQYIELYHMPSVDLYVFEKKEKAESTIQEAQEMPF